MRLLWLIMGYLSLGLGAIGVVLPLLPTTPFVLLAAFCFAKSSPALHAWLLQHKSFGKAIRDWQEHRAISARAKLAALAMMALALGLSLLFGVSSIYLSIQAAVLAAAAIFILTRNTAA